MFSSIIFFDLDNTLIEGPFGTAVFPIVLDELARKTHGDQKEIRRLIVKENLDRQNEPRCSAVKAMDWDDIFAAVANRLGVTIESNAEEIVQAQAEEHSRLLDGARETLIALQHPSRALIVATKGLIKYQRPVLDALGITHLFTEILTPDSHNALKKDRAFYGEWLGDSSSDFRSLLDFGSLGNSPIIVGDYYVDDVIPPHQFGMRTVWKNAKIEERLLEIDPLERPQHFEYTDDQHVKPTAIIKSLHELPDVITQLENRNPSASVQGAFFATKQSHVATEIAS